MRYICLHGHFYQPPRDNPWRPGHIEAQPSAEPFHDWNERIDAECYAPNARAKVGDKTVNNYERISFDFGPTLLEWLEAKAPDTYAAVLAADRQSTRRFSGHGGAMAQAYNHTILPLATAADKRTQIQWGLEDFAKRFNRRAEGLWLPECAVDVATLEALAESDVRFTVLSPQSLTAVRRVGEREWRTPGVGAFARAYKVPLPSGRSLAVFFYNGDVALSVAFHRLLDDGGELVRRLLATSDEPNALVHIATDGESYGHHHRFGEMALAYALEKIDAMKDVRLTTYGEYLALHPPQWEAQIKSPSSWSCAHGVERWRSHCGCRGGRLGDSQAWRGPLRAALDELRAALDPIADPAVRKFAQLMFTSCGWFFDEPSDLETAQILAYAARAIELGEARGLDRSARERFLQRLSLAKSNVPEWGDARRIFLVTEAEQSLGARLDDPKRLLQALENVRPEFDVRQALIDSLTAKVARARA
jgi:hypothetical protein